MREAPSLSLTHGEGPQSSMQSVNYAAPPPTPFAAHRNELCKCKQAKRLSVFAELKERKMKGERVREREGGWLLISGAIKSMH